MPTTAAPASHHFTTFEGDTPPEGMMDLAYVSEACVIEGKKMFNAKLKAIPPETNDHNRVGHEYIAFSGVTDSIDFSSECPKTPAWKSFTNCAPRQWSRQHSLLVNPVTTQSMAAALDPPGDPTSWYSN